MATISLRPMSAVSTISGGVYEIRRYPEAASQSFKKGELVYLASGKVTICGADPSLILGMAMEDATGTTDTSIAVAIANKDTVFEGNVYHGTPASAITAVTDIGTDYGVVNANNKWYVDVSDTSNVRILVRDLSKKDVVGDTYGRVLFQVMQDYCQLDTDANA
jgi:predicted RecA/RadA family phage recombinase